MGGLDEWLVKLSWSGGLVSTFRWVELYLFSLEGSEASSSESWDVYGFGMALGDLSVLLRAVFPLCWRMSVACPALELVGSWVELGFSVTMEAFGRALVY